LAQLTKQHGHELVPTGKAFGPKAGFKFPGMAGKSGTLKKTEDLAKKTAGAVHLDLRG
jgi:hypothetical protein